MQAGDLPHFGPFFPKQLIVMMGFNPKNVLHTVAKPARHLVMQMQIFAFACPLALKVSFVNISFFLKLLKEISLGRKVNML